MQLSAIGLDCASKLGDGPSPVPKTGNANAYIDWYGEVVSLLLDGRVMVRLPSGLQIPVPLNRLYHLDDGLEGGMDLPVGPLSESDNISNASWETDREVVSVDDDTEMGWAEEEVDDSENQQAAVMVVDATKGEEAPDLYTKVEDRPFLPADAEDHTDWRRFIVLEEVPSVSFVLSCDKCQRRTC